MNAKRKHLAAILVEEAELLEENVEGFPDDSYYLAKHLRSAAKKLESSPQPQFTSKEREAMQYSLEDLGGLYRHTGTPGGFHAGSFSELLSSRRHGLRAMQAAEPFEIAFRVDPNPRLLQSGE